MIENCRGSRSAWVLLCCAACSRRPCFSKGLGFDDPQGPIMWLVVSWFCGSCGIVQLQGEARVSIWDRADWELAAFVTAPATAFLCLSSRVNFSFFSRNVPTSLPCWDLSTRYQQPVIQSLVYTCTDSWWLHTKIFSSVPRGDPQQSGDDWSCCLSSYMPPWELQGEQQVFCLMGIWPYHC